VADAQPPEGPSEGPPSGPAESQDQGESEGTAVKKHAVQTKDARLPWYRVVAAAVLLLAAIGLVLWLFVRPPDSFAAKASLVIAAAVAFGAGAVCLPLGLRHRLGTFAIVAGTFAGIMAAILAIPGGAALPSGSDESNDPASQSSPPSPTSPSPDESDPFTWSLNFHATAYCEGFVVKNSLLKSPPEGDKLNAEWAYENGGATHNDAITLTIQGRSDDAVVIENLYVVDVQMEDVSSDLSVVYPCNPGGGPIFSRYFEVVLDKRPRLKQYPGTDEVGEPTEPIKKFPYKVTKDDVEVFYFILGSSGPACICSWKLALDWTSGGRSGRTIIDRKFSSIRTFVPDPGVKNGYYERGTEDGEWHPPLPE
jgi:hypothetical protein